MSDTRWWWCVVLLAPALAAASLHPRSLFEPDFKSVKLSGDTTYRLSRSIVPKHYQITIIPDFSTLTLEGTLHIDIEVAESTSTVKLHVGENVKVNKYSLLRLEDGDAVESLSVQHSEDRQREFFAVDVVEGANALEVNGTYRLTLEYTATIGTDGMGFYKATYKEGNVTKWLGVTQFEPTYARRAFPCFDEPGFRASFQLTVAHPEDKFAVSTTRVAVVSRSERGGLLLSTFEKTPPMPTYTLAWLVSELAAKGSVNDDFRSLGRPDVARRLEIAQEEGPLVLEAMERYTGIPYYLEKLDQVAVPTVFYFGAMENWGLVTYRESYLLSDPFETKSAAQLEVYLTIAHELVHQWFGNLVTPSWWSHAWISEGFAQYFQYVILDELMPQWGVMQVMPVYETHKALVTDASDAAIPMTYNVNTPDEVLNNFGVNSYKKGSSVLRMVEDLISAATFRKGLQIYLRKMQLKAAEPDDLWDALQQAADQDGTAPANVDLKTFCKSWTDSTGYPIVTALRDYAASSVEMQQGTYSKTEGYKAGGDWWVHLNIVLANKMKATGMLEPNGNLTAKVTATKQEWMLINPEQKGYFRVNYDTFNWLALATALNEKPNTFAESSRAMLIDDALSLARMGLLDYPVALRVLEYLPRERGLAPWTAAAKHIDDLALLFRGSKSADKIAFNAWVRTLVARPFRELGLERRYDEDGESDESVLDGVLRSVIGRLACQAEHPECVAGARKQYTQWRAGSGIPADTLSLALCQGLAKPGARADDLQYAKDKFFASTDEVERADIIQGVSCVTFDNRQILLSQVAWYDAGMDVEPQDARRVWNAVASTQTGLRVALEVLTKQQSAITGKYGRAFIETVVGDLASLITTEENFAQLKDFVRGQPASTALDRAVQRAQSNLDWRAASFAAISDYLAAAYVPAEYISVTALPESLVPIHYTVELVPEFELFKPAKLLGSVEIDVRTAYDTDVIAFNAGADIEMEHLVVSESGGEILLEIDDFTTFNQAVTYDEKTQILTLSLPQTIKADTTYTIAIQYSNRNNEHQLDDAFVVVTLPDGLKKFAAINLKSSNAAQVVPCFNDPRFTAPFDITVAAFPDQVALSNMPLKRNASSQPDVVVGDRVYFDFKQTDQIPVSLVTVAVFDTLAKYTSSDERVSLYVRDELGAEQGNLTLDYIVRIITKLETKTGVAFPAPKLDVVAVPGLQRDVISGPGLWIVREGDLVASPEVDNSTANQELSAALLIANQAVHAYIGHKVTFDSTDSLWLEEGIGALFESWLVQITTARRFGGAADRLGVTRVQNGLIVDALETAKPLTANAPENTDKGAGMVRMLLGYIGGPALLDAAMELMNKKPGKVSYLEVVNALQKASDNAGIKQPISVEKLLETWRTQPGHPVVSVSRNYEKGSLTLRQDRFAWNPLRADKSLWDVPYNAILGSQKPSELPYLLNRILSDRTGLLEIDAKQDDYVLVNVNQGGFYRVNYDNENWRLLTAAVESKKISASAQRAALLEDASVLSRAQKLDVKVVLELLRATLHEEYEDYAPWFVARRALAALGHLTRQDDRHRAAFKRFVADLTQKAFTTVGWEKQHNETWNTASMRTIIADVACAAGNVQCETQAYYASREWMTYDQSSVDGDVLTPTICYKMRHGPSEEDFTQVIVVITSTEDSSLRRAYISGLGCVNNEEMRELLIKRTADASAIDKPDVLPMFEAIMDNSDQSLDAVVMHVTNNFQAMREDLGNDIAYAVMNAVAERVTTYSQLTLLSYVMSSFEDYEDMQDPRLEAALNRAEANFGWAERMRPAFVDWVYAQLGETPPPPLTTTPLPDLTTAAHSTPPPKTTTSRPLPTDHPTQPPTHTTTTARPYPPDHSTSTTRPHPPDHSTTTTRPHPPDHSTTTPRPHPPDHTTTGRPTSSSPAPPPPTTANPNASAPSATLNALILVLASCLALLYQRQ